MWNKFEPSVNEDETLGNSFYTAGLFKITNEEKVREVSIEILGSLLSRLT